MKNEQIFTLWLILTEDEVMAQGNKEDKEDLFKLTR